MAQCCEGETAVLPGSDRLIRNEDVSPEAIREGGVGVERQRFQSAANLERMLVHSWPRVCYSYASTCIPPGIKIRARLAIRS